MPLHARYNLAKRAKSMMNKLFLGKKVNLDSNFLPKKRALNASPKPKKNKKKRRSKKISSMSATVAPVNPIAPLLDSQVTLPASLVGVGTDGSDAPARFYQDPIHLAKKLDRNNIPFTDEYGVPLKEDDLYMGYMSPTKRGMQDPAHTLLSPVQSPALPDTPPTQVSPPVSPFIPSTQMSPLTQTSQMEPSIPFAVPVPVPNRVPYPDLSYTPAPRDYACDYEAVMIALGDMNRLSRFLFRGGVMSRVHEQQDPAMNINREDVVEVLQELKDMMIRMFARFPERFTS